MTAVKEKAFHCKESPEKLFIEPKEFICNIHTARKILANYFSLDYFSTALLILLSSQPPKRIAIGIVVTDSYLRRARAP
jgi:hypothetical protein